MTTNDNGPKVVVLPAQKNEAAAAGDAIRRQLDALIENAKTIAKIRRANFDAYKAEGFTDAQALELCCK
jgi:hypothetical protein